MTAPPPVEPMPLPEAEGWFDYWTTVGTAGDPEREAAIVLRAEYERLRGIAEAATALVARRKAGPTFCAPDVGKLLDALVAVGEATGQAPGEGGGGDDVQGR